MGSIRIHRFVKVEAIVKSQGRCARSVAYNAIHEQGANTTFRKQRPLGGPICGPADFTTL